MATNKTEKVMDENEIRDYARERYRDSIREKDKIIDAFVAVNAELSERIKKLEAEREIWIESYSQKVKALQKDTKEVDSTLSS